MNPSLLAQIIDAFKVFDVDGTGTITGAIRVHVVGSVQYLLAESCYVLAAADLKHVMTSIGEKLTAEQAESMMTEADVDGGGKLNCEGFHALV